MRITLNRSGMRQLLRSSEVLHDLERRARSIANAAGPGFEVDSEIARNRARVSVRTATAAARASEATDRSLTRAIDAGRH